MVDDRTKPVVSETVPLVFLIDVDNTLLDNDAFLSAFSAKITEDFGAEAAAHYWDLIETHRRETGYVDYLGAIQQFRSGLESHPRLLSLAEFAIDYPFADRLFPKALEVLADLGGQGVTAILSDGDVVFQPRKVKAAGIWNAVEGRVLIQIHKQNELERTTAAYPAAHYVMVDDKVNILSAMKKILGSRLTTVFVRQGHYAKKAIAEKYPPADIEVDVIGDLLGRTWRVGPAA